MTKIFGNHCTFKAARRRERQSREGRVCNNAYFTSLKLDKHGIDVEVLARENKEKKIFHYWKEG